MRPTLACAKVGHMPRDKLAKDMTMTRTACHTLAMRGITVAATAAALITAIGGTAVATKVAGHDGTRHVQAVAHPPINRQDLQECRCELAELETVDGLRLTFYNHSGHAQTYVLNIWRVYHDNLAGVYSQRVTSPVAAGQVRVVTVPWRDEWYIAAAFAAQPDNVGIQADGYYSRP